MNNLNPTLLMRTPLALLFAIILCNLYQITYSESNSKHRGFRLKLIHIDSPRSPFYRPELTNLERTKRLIAISNSRSRYFAKNTTHKSASRYHKQEVNPVTIYSQYHHYYVELGLGEFGYYRRPRAVYLGLDTGSKYTWTQCEGCRRCFNQRDPRYANDRSKTFVPYACDRCPGRCTQNHCTYTIDYSDDTAIHGFWGEDKLTFLSYMYDAQSLPGFFFLCGIEIDNFHEGNRANNVITGNLGMGIGDQSLISQLWSKGYVRSRQFSYCLQDTRDGHIGGNTPCNIRFGDDANFDRRQDMSITPIILVENRAYYHLSLHDISVNNIRLNIPPQFLVQTPGHSAGTIIDSGTSLTFLVEGAYTIFLAAISTFMANNNPSLQRYENSVQEVGNEACWEPTVYSPTVVVPTVTYHLANDADLVIDPAQVMSKIEVEGVAAPGLYCLDVNAETDPTEHNIIGTYNQVHQLMIFDLDNLALSFIPYDCDYR